MSYRIGHDPNWYLWAGEVNVCLRVSMQVGRMENGGVVMVIKCSWGVELGMIWWDRSESAV